MNLTTKPDTNTTNDNGFTLIELLVVTIIIGIIGAISAVALVHIFGTPTTNNKDEPSLVLLPLMLVIVAQNLNWAKGSTPTQRKISRATVVVLNLSALVYIGSLFINNHPQTLEIVTSAFIGCTAILQLVMAFGQSMDDTTDATGNAAPNPQTNTGT